MSLIFSVSLSRGSQSHQCAIQIFSLEKKSRLPSAWQVLIDNQHLCLCRRAKGEYDLPCAVCYNDRFSQPTVTVISLRVGTPIKWEEGWSQSKMTQGPLKCVPAHLKTFALHLHCTVMPTYVPKPLVCFLDYAWSFYTHNWALRRLTGKRGVEILK